MAQSKFKKVKVIEKYSLTSKDGKITIKTQVSEYSKKGVKKKYYAAEYSGKRIGSTMYARKYDAKSVANSYARFILKQEMGKNNNSIMRVVR